MTPWCRVCGLCAPDPEHRHTPCPGRAFTEAAPLTKALAAPSADMPAAYHGAFVELPCLACHGRHAPGEGCGH